MSRLLGWTSAISGGRNTDQQVRLTADLTAGEDADTLARLRRDQMTALANHIRDLDRLLATNLRQIRDLVTAMCPPLLKQPGIGPVTAAVALLVAPRARPQRSRLRRPRRGQPRARQLWPHRPPPP